MSGEERRSEKLFDAITDLPEEMVAASAAGRRRRRRLWAGALAAVLALALLAGGLLRAALPAEEKGGGVRALALAAYPERVAYPIESDYFTEDGQFDGKGFMEAYEAWFEERRRQLGQPEGYDQGLAEFCAAILPQFLSGGEGENRLCSPLNVYFALGMLAELTEGESRQQLLDLLGRDSLEDLRAQAEALWSANYCDDGSVTSVLASSLWLREGASFAQEPLETLAETYRASSYQGQMGSEAMNRALQTWLSDQTGGLLADQAEGVELSADTVLALAATIYFKAGWGTEFQTDDTAPAIFHAPGGDVEVDFMHQSEFFTTYCWGERFTAAAKQLTNSGAMWVILPDEGVTPEDLLADGEAVAFLLSDGDWENRKEIKVNWTLPKFDVVSQMDLTEGLRALGVTDVFDPAAADFSPVTEVENVAVSQAQHAVRVAVDEVGITAAAYTVLGLGAGEPPEDEVDFVVDRPFLFCVTGAAGQPLFVGVVNSPAG